MNFRKFIIVTFLGILFGGVVGVGYSYWHRYGFPIPWYGPLAPVRLEGLEVSCSWSIKPTILVSWNKVLKPYASTLQRSVDGGPWNMIGVPIQTSGQPHVVDKDVKIGSRYLYRMLKGSSQISDIVKITVNETSCKK